MKTKNTNWTSLVASVLLAGLVFALHVRLYQYAYDDAYIHFRIAGNFLDNGAPYFNENEAVKVSTSSGWTVMLSVVLKIIRVLKLDSLFPLTVSIVNAIFTIGGMFVYTKIVEMIKGNKLGLYSKLFFQIPYIALLLPSSIGLMETPFALLIAGWGIYLLLRSKPSGFALLGFATYIRIELLILLVLVIAIILIQNPYKWIQVISSIGIGTIPLLLYDLYFFGTVIPHSIFAKSLVFTISRLDTIKYILFFSLPTSSQNYNSTLISFLLFSTILTSTTIVILQKQKAVNIYWYSLFLFWGFLTISGYTLGHALMFQWYIPLYTIPLFIACFLELSPAKHLTNYMHHILVFAVFLISINFIFKTTYASINDPSAFINFTNGARVRTYLRAGNILYEEYPQATLMTTEIGGLGYSFEGKIFDAAGLASPDVLIYHPMKIPEQRDTGGIGAIPPGYVREKMPDLIVSYDYFTQALLKDVIAYQYNMLLIPAYLPEDAEYSMTKTVAGNKYLRIFIRKDLQISEKLIALGK